MMSSYLPSFSSIQAKLLFTAALSASVTAFLVFSVNDLRHKKQRKALRDEIRSSKLADESLNAFGLPENEETEAAFDDTLIKEFLARNIAFLGEEQCMALRDKFVVVVGMGGVGSAWCV